MKILAADGDFGPGVRLNPDQVSQALEWAKQPADFYRRNPEWGNNRNQARLVENVHLGTLAEYGVREFYSLPHDGHLRIGKPDLGQRTDVKGIQVHFHRLISVGRSFKRDWRYLLAWCANVGDGQIDVRIMGWAEGTNPRWEYFPKGLDQTTGDPRPMYGILQRFLNVQAYQVAFLRDVDW